MIDLCTCRLTYNPVEAAHCFLFFEFFERWGGGGEGLFVIPPRIYCIRSSIAQILSGFLMPSSALKAFSMAHRRLAADEMAHLVSQYFCCATIV